MWLRDKAYDVAGALAALLLALIFLATMARIVGRLFGVVIPGADDFAGLFLAGASFLALAYTLRWGGHIRVTMALKASTPRIKWLLEVGVCVVSITVTGLMSYYIALMAIDTFHAGEYTLGFVPVRLWIPQTAMFVGVFALFMAFIDMALCLISGREYFIKSDIPAAGEI